MDEKLSPFPGVPYIVTYLVIIVGLGLVAFYNMNPLPADVASRVMEEPDRIFPIFIINELPVGLSGLLIASIFATGISTMDSVLAALSQTFVTGIYLPLRGRQADARKCLWVSRLGIVIASLLLCFAALALTFFDSEGLLVLGLSLAGYTQGAMLGLVVLAVFRVKISFGIMLGGTVLAIGGVVAAGAHGVAFPWWFPLGFILFLLTAGAGAWWEKLWREIRA